MKHEKIAVENNTNKTSHLPQKTVSERKKKIKNTDLIWLGFYGISIIEGYLMPNPFYTYLKYYL